MFFARITFTLIFFLSLSLSLFPSLSYFFFLSFFLSVICSSSSLFIFLSFSFTLLRSAYLFRTLANFHNLSLLLACTLANMPARCLGHFLLRDAQPTWTDHAHAVGRRRADSVTYRIAVCDHRSAVHRMSHTHARTLGSAVPTT